ncbi:helicase C-terminal domain-containing protein [Hydrogenophaga sp. NFH-34]|uniref:helicase C-terminal domain-containing protein n=1 Tax=Hydrogenophaga sp. NFH-34 TaxID=2744446 RepID=UPI001F2DC6D1|nr:helicase C-terminal domain-containing protein [Hydrogenophaga sp. NFH-34]
MSEHNTSTNSTLINGFIAKAYAALPIVMPGFKPREQQKQMIKRSAALFARETAGIIDAPTGTGKSMGYLLPGIITAALQDRVLIISTATASLQDQLAARDIPAAIQAISSVVHEGVSIKSVTVAVAKGRERYACPMSLESVVEVANDMFQSEQGAQECEKVVRLHRRLESGEWDGVRDSLDEALPHATWRKIANNALTCTSRNCPAFDDCPYYKVQDSLKTARVIITNHDYLLTCLSRVPNSPLADQKAIYVFDEGHHLGDKLISAFARRLDFGEYWDESIKAVLTFAGSDRDGIDFASERVRGMWNATAQSIATMIGDGTMHRFRLGEAPPQFMDLLVTLAGNIDELKDRVSKCRDRVRQKEKEGGSKVAGIQSIAEIRFGELLSKIEEAQKCIAEYTGEEELARWLERGRQSLEICCSPFNPADKARKHLWPVVKTALITSATIAALGEFKPTIFSLGMPEKTPTLKLDTPFDRERARLYVPRMALDGNDPGHGRRVIAYLKDLSSEHQGVLVYFTSRKLMQECFEALPEHIKQLVLIQGKWQPSSMLDEHRRRIDAGRRSVIFGLDSVGEGVDLPGTYCTQVVITKLPFPTQEDPVIATHGEYLKERGKEPFNLLTLPVCGRKFAQVCGRLMRRESDYGEIMVLDRRLISKRYGSRIVASTQFTKVLTS